MAGRGRPAGVPGYWPGRFDPSGTPFWGHRNCQDRSVPPELIAFCGVAAVLVITPGPDMALVARNALVGGRRAATMTTLGISAGIVIHALAAAGGLSALLRTSAAAYAVVKIAGGAYLLFLGVQAIRASLREEERRGRGVGDILTARAGLLGGSVAAHAAEEPERSRMGEGAAFRQGFVTNVLNPKLIVFFISVLPQFTSGEGGFFGQVVVLGIAFEILTLAWLLPYGAAVARAGEALRRPAVRRFLERLTGSILIALGLRVAVDGAGDL